MRPAESTKRCAVSLLPHSVPRDLSERIGRAVARTGLTPNALTVIGLLGMGGAAALAAYGLFWQAGVVLLAAAAFDMLDGAVARATDRASDWGAVFDAVCDRLADFAILFGLLIWFSAADRFDRTAIALIGASLFGSMMVSYTRSKAGEFGVQIRSGLGTRLERVLIVTIGLLSGEIVVILWLLAVLTNLTALQRLIITWRALSDATFGARPAPATQSPRPPELSGDAEADKERKEADGPFGPIGD